MIKKILVSCLAMLILLCLVSCKTGNLASKNKDRTEPAATTDSNKDEIITVYVCTEIKQLRNDQEFYRHEYEYDSNGNLIREISYYYDYDPAHTNSFEYAYDSKGRMTQKTSFVNSEEATREEYEYAEDDKHATMVCYTNNEFHCSWEYEYNSNGNQILAIQTRGGKEAERYEYEYDDNGNLITKISYYNGRKKQRYEYKYNHNGKLIFDVNYQGNVKHSTQYEYDDNSNLVLEVSYINNRETNRYEYEYDSKGNLVQSKTDYRNQPFIYTYVYTYTDDGCVVERTSDTKEIFIYQKTSLSRAQAEKIIEESGDLAILFE